MSRAALMMGMLMFLTGLFAFQYLITGQQLPDANVSADNVSANQSTVSDTGGSSWFTDVLNFFGLSGAAEVVQTLTDGLGALVSTFTSFFSADVDSGQAWIKWAFGVLVTVPLTYIVVTVLRGSG